MRMISTMDGNEREGESLTMIQINPSFLKVPILLPQFPSKLLTRTRTVFTCVSFRLLPILRLLLSFDSRRSTQFQSSSPLINFKVLFLSFPTSPSISMFLDEVLE